MKKYSAKGLEGRVDSWTSFWQDNAESFKEDVHFLTKSNLTDQDREVCAAQNIPPMENNLLTSYVSRLLGEFFKQQPSLKVDSNKADAAQVQLVEAYLRNILSTAEANQEAYKVYRDQLQGGFSCVKLFTQWKDQESFNQCIKFKHINPVFAGFDPSAKLPTKQDGNYCFQFVQKTAQAIKDDYKYNIKESEISSFSESSSGFCWADSNYDLDKRKYTVIDMHCKRFKSHKLYYLSDGRVVDKDRLQCIMEPEDIEGLINICPPPKVIDERKVLTEIIDRVVFCKDKILYKEETKLTGLPLIFVDGNSCTTFNTDGCVTQRTKSYINDAKDAQRLHNFCLQHIANEMQNINQSQFMVPVEGLSEDVATDWTDPSTSKVLRYESKDMDGNPLSPPQPVSRNNIPPQYAQILNQSQENIQSVLGSYNAQMGLTKGSLSGVAIMNATTQNNAVAYPYIANFLTSWCRLGELIAELMPKLYIFPDSIPIKTPEGETKYLRINEQGTRTLSYKPKDLNVSITAGSNFELQRQQAIETIMTLAKTSPTFQGMLEQGGGLSVLMENIEIRGGDQLQSLLTKYVEQQRRQAMLAGQQQNPELLIQQQELKLQQEKLAIEREKVESNAQLAEQKLQNEVVVQNQKMEIELERLKLEEARTVSHRMQTMTDAHAKDKNSETQLIKAQVEQQVHHQDAVLEHRKLNQNHQQIMQDQVKLEHDERELQLREQKINLDRKDLLLDTIETLDDGLDKQ